MKRKNRSRVLLQESVSIDLTLLVNRFIPTRRNLFSPDLDFTRHDFIPFGI
ncbi:MAG: hypothetical protein ACTSRP_07015 [Candidatus Helarchaeota archaeon]